MSTSVVPVEKQEAAAALERARLKAAVHMELLLEALTLRGLDPVASVRTVIDAFEANYKVSGMAAKQLAAEQANQGGFRLNIILSDRGGAPIEVFADRADDLVGAPPESAAMLPVSDDLTCDIHDE